MTGGHESRVFCGQGAGTCGGEGLAVSVKCVLMHFYTVLAQVYSVNFKTSFIKESALKFGSAWLMQ